MMREEERAMLHLYIAEYFVHHKVMKYPINAKDLESAVGEMNDFYAKNGNGNAHKSLECCTTGRDRDGTYYPPEKVVESDSQ